jgi:hypothetical protein
LTGPACSLSWEELIFPLFKNRGAEIGRKPHGYGSTAARQVSLARPFLHHGELMLFNSHLFLFAWLSVMLAGFFILGRLS